MGLMVPVALTTATMEPRSTAASLYTVVPAVERQLVREMLTMVMAMVDRRPRLSQISEREASIITNHPKMRERSPLEGAPSFCLSSRSSRSNHSAHHLGGAGAPVHSSIPCSPGEECLMGSWMGCRPARCRATPNPHIRDRGWGRTDQSGQQHCYYQQRPERQVLPKG